jgi:hypothetical protein
MLYLPLFSTLVTFIFAVSIFSRWRYKHSPHLLLWGLGLVFYGLGTLSEVILSLAYSPWILKLWYLCGAMLTAAWLGQGTVYLLVRRKRIAHTLMAILGAASLLALFLVVTAPLNPSAPAYQITLPASEQYKEILLRSGAILFLTILLNIYGTITLVGGALYSAYLFWRKSILAPRMWGNILIAAGALLPASSGSHLMIGWIDWLYLSEFLGVVLMYAGFRLATSGRPIAAAAPAPAD